MGPSVLAPGESRQGSQSWGGCRRKASRQDHSLWLSSWPLAWQTYSFSESKAACHSSTTGSPTPRQQPGSWDLVQLPSLCPSRLHARDPQKRVFCWVGTRSSLTTTQPHNHTGRTCSSSAKRLVSVEGSGAQPLEGMEWLCRWEQKFPSWLPEYLRGLSPLRCLLTST